jgi:hypothetical protein
MRSKLPASLPFFFVATGWAVVPLATHCSSSSATSPSEAPLTPASAVTGGQCNSDQECSLPPSQCGSNGDLIYYNDARCVSHACQYQEQRMSCAAACSSGGCFGTTTSGNFVQPTGAGGAAGQGGVKDTAELDATAEHVEVLPPDGGVCSGEDASVCQTPPSRCADTRWLAYFTNTSCDDAGACHWEVGYKDCGDLGCQDPGGCRLNITQ